MSCHYLHALNNVAVTLETLESGGESIVSFGAATAEQTSIGHAVTTTQNIQPPNLISHATVERTKLAAVAEPHRDAKYLQAA